jgi:lysophospholipase L1-like esterase
MTSHPNRRTHRIPILVAFAVQLLIPLALCLDVLVSWRLFKVMSLPDRAVFVFSALWVAIGIGVLLISRGGNRFLDPIGKSLLTIYALCLSLAILELSARVFIKKPQPTLYSPGSKYAFHRDIRLTPGVDPFVNFTVNEVGLRGPAIPYGNNVFKIITVGGSTTLCDYLDDSNEWPHLLMEDMTAGQSQQVVWVANAGVAGATTVHHIALLQTLPILSQADLLTFLIGVNDLQASLAFEGAPAEAYLKHDAALVREQILAEVGQMHPWYRQLRLFQLAHKAAVAVQSRRGRPSPTLDKGYFERRRAREAASIVPLHDLKTGLKEYRDHVLLILHECQIRCLRCDFFTQPTIWRDNLTPAELGMLWGPYVGRVKNPKGYLSAADAARAMDAYNRALLDLCGQDNMECYDLASFIPKNTSAFYDDYHFTGSGARMVAQFISDHLLAASPFKSERPDTHPRALNLKLP